MSPLRVLSLVLVLTFSGVVPVFSQTTSDAPPLAAEADGTESLFDLLRRGGIESKIEALRRIAAMPLEELKAVATGPEIPETNPVHPLLRRTILERWAELDTPGLITAALASDPEFGNNAFESSFAFNAAFTRLAKETADAAWREAGNHRRFFKEWARTAVLWEIMKSDPRKALRLSTEADGLIQYEILAAWARKDPAAAAAFMEHRSNDPGIVETLSRVWAVKDYDAAAKWADTLPSHLRGPALYARLNAVAEREPERALELLESARIGMRRFHLIHLIISRMAARDFDAAVRRTLSFKNFKDQQAALTPLLEMASAADSDRLLKLAEALPPRLQVEIYGGPFSGFNPGNSRRCG